MLASRSSATFVAGPTWPGTAQFAANVAKKVTWLKNVRILPKLGAFPQPPLLLTPPPPPLPRMFPAEQAPPVVPPMAAVATATLVDDPTSQVTDEQAPLFPPLPSLLSASSWGSMADLRDNELSSMDDSPSVSEVTDKKKTKTIDKNVPEGTSNIVTVIENTVSNESSN